MTRQMIRLCSLAMVITLGLAACAEVAYAAGTGELQTWPVPHLVAYIALMAASMVAIPELFRSI